MSYQIIQDIYIYIYIWGREEKMNNVNNGVNDTEVFIGIVNTVREQTIEYILHKINKHKTIESFKKQLKDELDKIHKKNMEMIDKNINGS